MAGDSFGQAASGAAGITRQSERISDTGATIRHNRDVGPQKLRQDLVGGGTFHKDLFARDLFLTSSCENLPNQELQLETPSQGVMLGILDYCAIFEIEPLLFWDVIWVILVDALSIYMVRSQVWKCSCCPESRLSSWMAAVSLVLKSTLLMFTEAKVY